ncbi:hypothetical protein PENTCL1PPCAC_23736, partial [Pristionchus entomophagus]
ANDCMGNSVAREDRAISPLSAWGDRYEEFANGRYDIATPPPQRATVLPAKLDRSHVSARRRDSLELARLDAERRTNSAHSQQAKTEKKKKKKTIKAADAPLAVRLFDKASEFPSTYSLVPYPHDPPIHSPVHPNEFGLDAPVPGLLPRRKKTVAVVAAVDPFAGRKPWSAPTLPPPEPEEFIHSRKRQTRSEVLEIAPAPLAVPIVQPRRTDAVRVGKPVNPPVNPARLLVFEQGARRSSSVPRSTSSDQLMKPPPKRTQSDIGDASGIV